MTKTLTEQWRDGTLPAGFYYLEMNDGLVIIDHTIYVVGEKIYRWELSSVDYVKEVLSAVPSYDEVKEILQKIERLEFDNEALEMSRDELVQKMHILNEQNTKQYNELCEEIKKNNILEKKLEIATKALERIYQPAVGDIYNFETDELDHTKLQDIAYKALKEMEGVK